MTSSTNVKKERYADAALEAMDVMGLLPTFLTSIGMYAKKTNEYPRDVGSYD
jgi:hypothetical protein